MVLAWVKFQTRYGRSPPQDSLSQTVLEGVWEWVEGLNFIVFGSISHETTLFELLLLTGKEIVPLTTFLPF